MADQRKIVAAHMGALVHHLGCYDSVAETINARWGGGCSKGTISKKMSGQLDWSILDAIALQEAVGEYPINRLLARRQFLAPARKQDCLVVQTGIIAKESGEAISAILAAEHSSGAAERAQAVAEIDQALDALRRARDNLEALP